MQQAHKPDSPNSSSEAPSETARLLLRYAVAVAGIGAIAVVCRGGLHTSAFVAAAFCLAAIVAVSTRWGVGPALAGSAAAALGLNFLFLQPVLGFGGAHASRRGAVAFLVAAVAASLFARGVAPDSRAPAEPHDEMERLYALSRAILLIDPSRPVAKQIAYKVAQIFQMPALALYDRETGEIIYAGPQQLADVAERLREVALRGTLVRDAHAGLTVTAFRLGGNPIGSIAWQGIRLTDSALHAVSNLVAIGLERARGQEAAARAEVSRQGEELKSTLLDAIAHEFKTPLTSIRAAATTLLTSEAARQPETRELATIIDEEADRLGRLVSEALHMARVEGGKMQLAPCACSVRSLIDTTLNAFESRLEGRKVEIDVPPGLPSVTADSGLMALALRQLVDNAIKYSPARTPLLLRAKRTDRRMVVSVADRGFGINEAHLDKIFERFYRVPLPNNPPGGAGMGLAIAREIVTAHEGEIWVESSPGEGSEFFISMPIAREEARE